MVTTHSSKILLQNKGGYGNQHKVKSFLPYQYHISDGLRNDFEYLSILHSRDGQIPSRMSASVLLPKEMQREAMRKGFVSFSYIYKYVTFQEVYFSFISSPLMITLSIVIRSQSSKIHFCLAP